MHSRSFPCINTLYIHGVLSSFLGIYRDGIRHGRDGQDMARLHIIWDIWIGWEYMTCFSTGCGDGGLNYLTHTLFILS
jgi:hypothetical protein